MNFEEFLLWLSQHNGVLTCNHDQVHKCYRIEVALFPHGVFGDRLALAKSIPESQMIYSGIGVNLWRNLWEIVNTLKAKLGET